MSILQVDVHDSNLFNGEKIKGGEIYEHWNKCSCVAEAIDRLNQNIKDGKIKILNLFDNRKTASEIEIPEPIWYDISGSRPAHSYNIPTEINIFTSHFIGIYRTIINENNVQINIRPRFGDAVFNYLLSFASDIFVPENAFSSLHKEEQKQPLWLMAILWKAAFDKAISINHIPHDYIRCEENISALKGRLLFQQHIRHNLIMKHRLFCQYFKYTADNIINRTIRYSYRLLLQQSSGNLLGDASAWDNKLASFGVSDDAVTVEEIDSIVYTPMTESYQLLMEISKMLIEYDNLSSTMGLEGQESFSFFIDIAQIWENYIIKVLQKYMDKEDFTIESPNYEVEQSYLLENKHRWIKPDILIRDSKTGAVKAVLDAKYKFYNKIGRTAKEPGTVSREDLYQMTSYLWHYDKYKTEKGNLPGLFISPS
jgi:5-methylcytosine-specific restriction endonuclease McrBC regulatory subunit McrC